MKVFVVIQTPDGLLKKNSDVETGSRVADVLAALDVHYDSVSGLSIFNQRCTLETVLQDGDRIEISRPLLIDPKKARRLRAEKKASDHKKGRQHAS